MCYGIVIDGHVMRDFKAQLVQKNGAIYSLVSWITSNCGIAITDYIKTHWEQQCGTRERNTLFWEWYFDQLHNRHTIHLLQVPRLKGSDWIALTVKFKIPPDPFIRSAIECANSASEPRYILAEDMLLHDPIAKGTADINTQRCIREERSGVLCKYLERNFRIIVGTCNHCKDYFEVDQGACPNNSSNCISECPRVIRTRQ